MGNTNWKSRLAKLKNYKDAKSQSEEISGSQVEDGRYIAKITSCELATSNSSGRDQINMFTEIVEGEFEGQKPAAFLGLDEQSLRFTLAAISRLGYELSDDPSDLEEIVKDLNTNKPAILIRIKNGFTNVEKLASEEGYQQEAEQEENESEEAEKATEDEEVVEEEEAVEEEQEQVALGEGDQVTWKGKSGEMTGKITKVLEDEGKALIKADKDGKTYKVAADLLSPVEDTSEDVVEEEEEVEEEVEEEPKKKPAPAKKAAPAKAAKKVVKKKK